MSAVGDIVREENIIGRAIQTFGSEHQQLIAIEEMSELQEELCKLYRGIGNREHIVEEIADVQIMLDQLKMIFDCKEEVMDWMTLKLLRLENRIEEYDGPPAGEAEGLRNWSPFKEEEHEKE